MSYNQEKAEASFFNSGPDNRIVDIEAGANVTIDKTNPKRPKISASGGGGGGEGGSVDLTNYYNKAEVDAIAETKTDVGHTHTMDNVTGLVAALAGKAATSHTHTIANVNNLQSALDGKAATTHNHTISNVTGLQDALDNLAAGQGGEGGTVDLSNYYNKTQVDGFLTNKAAKTHLHEIDDVNGLRTALNNAGGGEGGSTPIDVPGGALSYSRGTDIELRLKSFLEDDFQANGPETAVYDSTVKTINGITALEKTGLYSNGTTFPYLQDYRLYTFLNVPTTFEGYKMKTIRYEGEKYTDTNMANVIGIKNNVLTPLITGNGSVSVVNEIVDVSDYDFVHISGDVEVVGKEIIITIVSDPIENETLDPEDLVKKYIDQKLQGDTGTVTKILKSFMGKEPSFEASHSYPFETDSIINGVAGTVNTILRVNNTTFTWNEDGVVSATFLNVPTIIDGVKQNWIRFVGKEMGGIGEHSSLLGIKEDNSIVNLIPATANGNVTPFLDVLINISEFKELSIQFIKNAQTAQELQYIAFATQLTEGIPISSDSVKKYIDTRMIEAEVETNDFVYVDKPTTMPRIYITGQLPTDTTDARTPTNVVFRYQYNNRDVFKCNATMAIQGNWTVFENKKGYEFAFTNATGDDLKVQIGDWIPCNEFHFKAYPNDSSFSRDVTAMKIWHQIRTSREWPESYIADFKPGTTGSAAKEDLMSQALFYTDGFPTECYLNGQFQGIYVFRLKKERDNYMLDNSNPNHVFLDNQDTIDWVNFDPADWKVRSPKIAGYKETQPITDVPLMNKLTRWWNWFKALEEDTVVYADTKDDYINEGSWVDAFIAQQVTGHWDYQVNNILLTSWDGQRLSVCFYDADQTWGWTNAGSTTGEGIWYRSGWWINTLYPNLLPAIKERYTWLRQNGILTMNNIHNTFKLSTGMISKDMYLKEYAVWPPTHGNAARHTLRNSLDWAQDRLVQLDAVWLLP